MWAVIWMGVALDALADAFVQADPPRRDEIEQAVLRLNAGLATDPFGLGESRDGRRRIAFDDRCAIIYRTDDPSPGVVRVTHFWTY